MNDGGREVVGFVCRWCLLALAGVAAIAVVAASVAAATSAGSNLRASMVMSDSVQGLGDAREYRMAGRLASSAHRGVGFFMFSRPGDDAPAFARAFNGRIYFDLCGLGAGAYRVPYAGVPYGPYAFHSGEATLTVVKPETGVFLVDARLAERLDQTGRNTLRACLSELRNRGRVAFLHPGTTAEFVRARDRLRELYSNLPIVWDVGYRNRPIHTLWHTRHRVTIVTADADLAASAGGQRAHFGICFIGQTDPRFEGLAKLNRYDSLANWRSALGGHE